MAAVAEAIGIVSGLLGIVQFGIDNFASEPGPGSSFKVAVALDGANGGTDNAGGDLPDVRVWNEYTDFVGITADPGTVGDGNIGTVDVEHENQGVYTLFSANNDAICIAWVTTTWSDERGGNEYAVSGDFGKQCGATWYYSGMFPSSDSDYQPACFWIDGNGDQPKTGFQVYWPSYSGTEFDESNTDPNTFCNGVDFGIRDEPDPNTVTFWTKKQRKSTQSMARSRRRAAWTSSALVLSDTASHSAKELCQSDTSMGPDFVHTTEGLFCDMGSKTLFDICRQDKKTNCFDLDSNSLLGNGTAIHRRGLESGYTSIRDWRSSA
ncbi:hypothetical protein GMORB2_5388 [Geosmithia morbida]|uniref:Uncharacterized protein n=1 Tax=Geosmithia morbida TaxID=1094350 RepID=A0A9P4YY99_9HYPO|nr:uncharacterized protein GMORB2_5388 [Geosmithia morbida]KAF4124722.1 hypothetical protein GMORB2_5388 [Geosmithia morbida]